MRIKMFIAYTHKQYSVLADDTNNTLVISSKHYDNKIGEFIKKVFEITKDWPEVCSDKSTFDDIHYQIEYLFDDGKKSRIFVGNNDSPDNFGALIALIEKIINPDNNQQRKVSLIESEYQKRKNAEDRL